MKPEALFQPFNGNGEKHRDWRRCKFHARTHSVPENKKQPASYWEHGGCCMHYFLEMISSNEEYCGGDGWVFCVEGLRFFIDARPGNVGVAAAVNQADLTLHKI